MDTEIEETVRQCEICNAVQKNSPRGVVKPWLAASNPWERVHVDLPGPVEGLMYLLVVDSFSKWPEVVVLPNVTSASVIDALKTIFTEQGVPIVLVTDNGRQFVSSEFAMFCSSNGIQHVTTAPYMPQSNGQVERFVDTFKRAVAKKHEGQAVRDSIRDILMMYRSTPHPSIQCSPSEMLMKRRIRTVLDLMTPRGNEYVEQRRAKMERWGRGPNKGKTFRINQAVWTRDYSKPGQSWTKGTIVGREGDVMYVLKVRGILWRRHANQIRAGESRTSFPVPVVVPAKGRCSKPGRKTTKPLENVRT
uniref:Integrase catalytic domain-containing protein n=1 Tax=Trichuris muris TaxID=70415 RepID=A0A5S6QG50_TRIMR